MNENRMKVTGNIRHEFLCTDPGTGCLYRVSPEGEILWTHFVKGPCYDVWALPDGGVLYCHFGAGSDGITVLNKDGSERFCYETTGEVFCCQPLDNGRYLVGELVPCRLTEVNEKGEIERIIPVDCCSEPVHERMRMVKKTANSYLIVQPGQNRILRLDLQGNQVAAYPIHPDAFGVVEKENGHLLYTCMSGAYELDESGCEVWSLTRNDLSEVNILWLLDLQLLENGNMVFCNWMGHGHEGEGIAFFEVTPQKELVWSCDSRSSNAVIPAAFHLLNEK